MAQVKLKEKEKIEEQTNQNIDSTQSFSSKTPTVQTTNKDIHKTASIASKLVGEAKELGKYWKVVEEIESFDEQMQGLTDAELKAKTRYFRDQFKGLTGKAIQKKLLEILPEAFAVVREAAFRVRKEKHYPVQLIGGMVLNEGRIAEMKTGEGKTLVSTLSGYLNALPEDSQVHIVTVNEYLARRDASEMGEVYNFLGLTVGTIQNQASFYFELGAQSDEKSDRKREAGLVDTLEDGKQQDPRTVLDVENLIPCERVRAYWQTPEEYFRSHPDLTEEERQKITENKGGPVDVVYGVNSEFGFDYLRDNMVQTVDEVVQKAGHVVAIVDEVDSILIDEARTPLIISSQDDESSPRYKQFAKLVRSLTPAIDYTVDERRKTVTLSELGVEKVERNLGIDHLYEKEENVVIIHHLDQALRAEALFRKDKEYTVRDGEIMIIDEFTGRIMYGRRYNQGLHQAIEAKEGVQIKPESRTTATVTYQNYFRQYKKLSGMTGTASTESEELWKIYKLLVVTIPTNKPVIRIDENDRIFKTELGKYKALVKDVAAIHKTGQPILIGTNSVEKNYLVSQLLSQAGIEHTVLNAKNHEQEALIISKAGKIGAVTLATNIAGRGVDIKLGGEIPDDEKDYEQWKKDHEYVKSLGGLYVIGTERNESRRVDNQLRGRSGRQGDPGKSCFYISFEDQLVRVYGGEAIGILTKMVPLEEDTPLEHPMLNRTIEEAQKRLEGFNFDTRKNVTEYDDVINRQRSVIYSRRKNILTGNYDFEKELKKVLAREIIKNFESIHKSLLKEKLPEKMEAKKQHALNSISKNLKNVLDISDFDVDSIWQELKINAFNQKKTAKVVYEKIVFQLESKWNIYSEEEKIAMIQFIMIRAIDVLWMEHLVTIDHLQDSVRFRGYSQKDPLVEFKQDGMTIFVKLLEEIDREIATTVFKVTPELLPSRR
jgi:preprotein translocase subunit SecA